MKDNKFFIDPDKMIEEIHKSKLTYCSYTNPTYARWDEFYDTLADVKNPTQNTVYRIHTDEHIPFKVRPNPRKRDKPRKEWTNFRPFKHYVWEGSYIEVLTSHCKAGKFCIKGCITQELAKMFITMANKLSYMPNWCGYTFREDMVSAGICHLVKNGLKYDETTGKSPFAYMTTLLTNEYIQYVDSEKEFHAVKDELRARDGLFKFADQPSTTIKEIH